MPSFGKKSLELLKTIDPRLQKILNAAIKEFDFTITEGIRTKERQADLVKNGLSLTMNSKHCHEPSLAVDIVPYPVDYKDTARFKKMAEVIKRIAAEQNTLIVWGGDWKTLVDMPHFELKQ